MKVLSWIFTILSFLAIPVLFLIWFLFKTDDAWWVVLIIGVALYAVSSFIAHLCIKNEYEVNKKGTKFLYYSSFPAYVLLYGIYFILYWVVKIIKVIFNAFTGNTSEDSGSNKGKVYIVNDGGYERRLKLCEKYKQDYDNPRLHYDRFKDDIGNYWRSYDDCETFIKETVEEKGRGY